MLTNLPFDLAYQAAEMFTVALKKRTKSAGFIKTLLLQRICSSFASGRSTAERMLRRETLEEEEQTSLVEEALTALTPEEAGHLRKIAEELSRPEARDPKLAAVRHFLTEHRTEGKTWLEHGCIIFGGLPDTIEDDWIENVEKLDDMMDEYMHLRQQARDVFEMRYQETIEPDKDRWELCSRVLSRRDIVDRLSTPW